MANQAGIRTVEAQTQLDQGGRRPLEAHEEIGLDPTSVHVLGTLPAFGLPDSGFLVTPVVAWCEEPRFLHAENPAEVSSVQLTPLALGRALRHPTGDTSADDGAALGVMTATVLDVLASRLAADASA